MNCVCIDSLPVCVDFASIHGLFRISSVICSNPRCTESHITLRFEEVNGLLEVKKIGSRFHLDLDLQTGKIKDTDRLPDVLVPVAIELEKGFTDDMLSAFKDRVHYEKETRRKIESFTMDPVDINSGRLVSFDDILNEGKVTSGNTFRFYLSWNETEYVVSDLYCPRPECDCRQVHLLFSKVQRFNDGTATAQEVLMLVEVPFKGKITLPEEISCTIKKAKEIINHFFACNPGSMDEFKRNYQTVKDIARRCIAEAGRQEQKKAIKVTPPEPAVKPGRNEPCFCGSGKKYKKCCGR
ncbi:MAG: YecA family protein [Candidatus Xenobiia bacterium LiM19]